MLRDDVNYLILQYALQIVKVEVYICYRFVHEIQSNKPLLALEIT